MALSSNDSWDKIEKHWKGPDEGSRTHGRIKTIYNIKLAKENIRIQKRMANATLVLAMFTVILCFVTFLMYKGSISQGESINGLKTTVDELKTSLQKIPTAIEQLGKSVKKIQKIEQSIKADKDFSKRIEERQIRERQKPPGER